MKVLLIAMTLVTLITVIPLSANAASDNKTQIFSYLTDEMGLNSAAACGIMANIEKESSFKPEKIIRDSNGLQSGGLCMWNGGRLNNLKKFCANKGLNYLSIEGQLAYLEYELQETDVIYLGVMEPNQPFENAIIRKKFTADDLYGGDIFIRFWPEDTLHVLPGKYYYQVKLQTKAIDPKTRKERIDVETVIDKTLFYIQE